MSCGRPDEEHLGVPRLNWESDHEWRCRTVFLDCNKDYYNGDRLAAYSMSWANWKFMGNTYTPEVQEILESCHSRLPMEIDTEIKGLHEAARPKITFVKSEELGGRNTHLPDGEYCEKNVKASPSSSHVLSNSNNGALHDDNHVQRMNEELIQGFTLYMPPPDTPEYVSPVCIINQSCQKCRIISEYSFHGRKEIEKLKFSYSWSLSINNILISSGSGDTKKSAKFDCAAKAIANLKNTQPIIYKSAVTHENLKTVEKDELVGASYKNAPKLDNDNIGNKMLRKMGWKGSGGVGKYESGLAEPVSLNAADGRRGVGHIDENKRIKKSTVEGMLMDFLRGEQNVVRFSSELNTAERKLVHQMCQKFKLKHKSHGKGKDRYLVVSKTF